MRGWTARVGLRKPGTPAWARSQLNDLIRDEWDELIESAHLTPAQVDAFQPWVNAEWAGALLGQMRWPGDPDHVSSHCGNRTLDGDHHATCDCPDDGPLDALVERQEQRRRDESLRAAKAKVDALSADQRARLGGEFIRAEQEAAAIMRHGKPRPQAGVRYRPVKGALLGPGSGIETPEQADRIVNALRGARPCCHTTGPNHHPACQEAQ